jgi:hypothetical protein
MSRFSRIQWLIVLTALLVTIVPRLTAQDDPDEIPLGDVARNLRKNNQLKRQVIDDDNLTDVMHQVDRDDASRSKSMLRFLMTGESKGFQLSAPDATCSLAFTANVKALLAANQYAQMDLPPTEIAKLEAQAAIEGDALTVPVFNGTQWHLSELAIALTVVKSGEAQASLLNDSVMGGVTAAKLSPAVSNNNFQEVRPEKKPDVTVIYRIRTAAPPWARAVFSAPLNLDLAPGEEWHWAIVEAKGYPPQAPDKASEGVGRDLKSQPESTPISAMPQANPSAVPAQNAQPEIPELK